MCGIAGFISDNPGYDSRGIVTRMLQKMQYRGPDQLELSTFDNCTMGMVRLSIIDSEEHEIPLRDVTGKRAIVYNGEIYNAKEIKTALSERDNFKTKSDAEVALYSYCEKGISAFNNFNGMYAFAIWDGILKEVIIVRDKVGEKPLYYCKGKDFFAFASEIKCLLEVIEPEFNDKAISCLAFEFSCGDETLFKNIICLEPGDYIRVKNGIYTIHSYWKVWENLIDVPSDYEKLKAELSELLFDAIALRTNNCAHQYGVFISGGVDSAFVACITEPDYIFTCHYDLGEDFDELNYAKMVARQIDRELIIIEPTPDDFKFNENEIAYHLDTPCTWTSFSWWMLLEKAAEKIKVIMTGDGADEVFGGYHRYLLLYNDEQIRHMEAMKKYNYLIDRYYGSPVERYARLINRCDNQNDLKVLNYLKEKTGYYFKKINNDVIHAMGITDFYMSMQVLLQMSDRVNAI